MAQAVEIVDELQRMREAALERSLVTAAADGSSAAFEQLYRRHAARVHALCLRMLRRGVYRACASAHSHEKKNNYFSQRRVRAHTQP